MISQVVLQFFFQLAFDHALSGHTRVPFVTLLFDYTGPVVQVHVLWFDSKGHALTSYTSCLQCFLAITD